MFRVGAVFVSLMASSAAMAQFMGGADVPEEVGEDFESSSVWGVPVAEVPLNSVGWMTPYGSASVSPLAAHRGGFGMRFTAAVLRGDGGAAFDAGSAYGPFIQFAEQPVSLVKPDAGLYFRTWLRVNTYPVAGQTPALINFFAEAGNSLDPLDGGWRLRNFAGSGSLPRPDKLVQPLKWHLVEVEYVRFQGVDGGSVRIWLDGTLHASQPNLPGLRTVVSPGGIGYTFGIIEQAGGDLDGSVDYDDFRRSRVPPASQLALDRMPSTASVECPDVRQVRIRLTSSQGGAAVAPYQVALDIDAGPGFAVGTLSNGCREPRLPSLMLGSDSVMLAVEGRGGGVLSVQATDFLPATLTLQPLMAADAGTDGGADPGSGADAGQPPLLPLLGCGCSGGGWPTALLLVLALSARRLRP